MHSFSPGRNDKGGGGEEVSGEVKLSPLPPFLPEARQRKKKNLKCSYNVKASFTAVCGFSEAKLFHMRSFSRMLQFNSRKLFLHSK